MSKLDMRELGNEFELEMIIEELELEPEIANNILDFYISLSLRGIKIDLLLLIAMIKSGEIPIKDFEPGSYNLKVLIEKFSHLFFRNDTATNPPLDRSLTFDYSEDGEPYIMSLKRRFIPHSNHRTSQEFNLTKAKKRNQEFAQTQRQINSSTSQKAFKRPIFKDQVAVNNPSPSLFPFSFTSLPIRYFIVSREIVKKRIRRIRRVRELNEEERALFSFYLYSIELAMMFRVLTLSIQKTAKSLKNTFSDDRKKITFEELSSRIVKPIIPKLELIPFPPKSLNGQRNLCL